MTDSYHVRIQKERLVFSAAHFITYGGDVCERLHGHNYHVYAEVHGPLNQNQYVIDFIALRDALQQIVDALDHRVLLPTEHPTIAVAEQTTAESQEVVAQHDHRRWTFPLEDCVLLPVANTTAEQLARYIADQLFETLGEAAIHAIAQLEIGVDECDGQWGVYRWGRV
jgi:6-pyruvoyltetrahydropterin/6-carboxytetrahydropterin synthase